VKFTLTPTNESYQQGWAGDMQIKKIMGR